MEIPGAKKTIRIGRFGLKAWNLVCIVLRPLCKNTYIVPKKNSRWPQKIQDGHRKFQFVPIIFWTINISDKHKESIKFSRQFYILSESFSKSCILRTDLCPFQIYPFLHVSWFFTKKDQIFQNFVKSIRFWICII